MEPAPQILALCVTGAATAYERLFSPAGRVRGLRSVVRTAKEMNEGTVEHIKELPPDQQGDLVDALDQKEELFIATAQVDYTEKSLEDEGFFRRYFSWNYSCEQDGMEIKLADVEGYVKRCRNDISNTSARTARKKQIIKEMRGHPPQSAQFSHAGDLDSGTLRRHQLAGTNAVSLRRQAGNAKG